jgi:predicted nuclease of predicted toxin-antitoxin system
VRFLIDECLTPDLVAVASEAGHEARHIARIGRAGWEDWNIVRYAAGENFVLVTNNASDYRRLYAAEPLHPGLVILIPNVGRALQQRLFHAALDQLAVTGEPVNQVLEVDLVGGEVVYAFYDLPAKEP